jgi:alpha-L-fucosidase
MWRGPAWANYNFLIALGLRRHGQPAVADDIVRRTVAAVRKHYEASGVLFEYYDALDERSPAACDRKGRRSGAYLSRPYGDAVRDYHWAAALTACHLLSIDGAWREPAAGERAVIRPNPKRRAYEALTRGVPFDLFAAAPASRAVPGPFPVPAPPDALDRWREDRVGMFVHWNMSALRSCTISWAMNYGGVPPDEYYALTRRFNPRHFDAREWAELVRGCGFANLLFVVKHHDGFALWDTDTTDLKITNTPYGRDLWRELTDACHRAGLPIGAYYSPADWQHPAARRGDWPAYYRFMRQQWRELFERYGRLDTFECDYWQDFCPQDDWAGFYRELRRRQPDVLFSRNTAWAAGDFEVHEWGVGRMTCDGQPPGPPPHEWTVMPDNAAWESLMSVDGRRWWSYNPDPCISFERLMAWVLASVVNDGNILCNFTPMASGEFPDDQLRLMYAFRDWMKVHAESIRGTRGGPYRPLHECGGASAGCDAAADAAPVMLAQSYGQAHLVPRVGSTRAGNRIYLHILTRLPGRWLSLPSPGPALRGASRLGAPGAPVEVRERDGSLLVRVPDEAGRQVDTVVVLDFAGSVMSAPPMDMSVARSPAT